MTNFEIKNQDCREVMRNIDENSIDSIITDPPYGINFLGKGWDKGIPGVEFWTEAIRVLKPGGYLLAFGGTRTFHRLTCAIEDSGFEIRDCLGWLYGSGFPKSHNIGKSMNNSAEWAGWGTALKPAWEPIILARKPLIGTLAYNVQEFRTGGLNIDAARVAGEPTPINKLEKWSGFGQEKNPNYIQEINTAGRWPANIMHDGSDETIGIFPETISGSAARFFYCAKPNKTDREEGNNHPTVKPLALMQYLCRLITAPGGLILDPFAGSGSTGKAAITEGFHFLGAEIDSEYAEIARARCSVAAAKIAPEITESVADISQLLLFSNK